MADEPDPRRSDSRRGRYFFVVTGPEANWRSPEEVEITCAVTLLNARDRSIVPHRVLDFYVVGKIASETADANGTASIAVTLPAFAPGQHWLTVQVSGEPELYRKPFILKPSPRQKSAEEIEVEKARLKVEKARLDRELQKISEGEFSPQEKQLAEQRVQLEIRRVNQQMRELAKPKQTPEEAALVRTRLEVEKAELSRKLQELQRKESPRKRALEEAELNLRIAQIMQQISELEAKTKPQPQKLAPPLVRAEGDEGEYLIAVSLTYEDGGPAAGVPLRFLVSESGAAVRPLVDGGTERKTDQRGFSHYELSFTAAECDVTLQGPGFEKKIENLQGPSRWPKPKPYQPPSDDELLELLQGTLRDVIRRARERGLARRKGGAQ